ncbi:AbgT family transporter [Bacteroidota bacterium]
MANKKSRFLRFLDWVERIADKLPDPFFLFMFLAAIILIISWIASAYNAYVIHPGTGEKAYVINLLNAEGIRRMFTELVKNFIEFPPLGVVLAALIGIGVADKSGLFSAAMRKLVYIVPKWALTFTLIFVSVNSNFIGDAGLVIMPAMGALLFASVGRHPIAGLTAAFAGVCGGFSANMFITILDPLLSGFTHAAAQMLDESYQVFPTANYYFMIVSTFLISFVGTFVNRKFVEPRLGKWKPQKVEIKGENEELLSENNFHNLTKTENKGLIFSGITFLVLIAILSLMVIPENGILRDSDGGLMPFYHSIIAMIIIIFLIPGTVFGITTGSIKRSADLAKMMTSTMGAMGAYLILAFAAGQFVAYFKWSNLGIVTAVQGANFLKGIGLENIPLIVAFLTFSAIMNIFIYSASAKWAILSPVFVPMLMILGYTPEMTQLIYRVGDSITNMITPLLPYFPIVIAFAKKYDKDISFGKLISNLMPYSIAFYIVWTIFLVIWMLIDLPIGPGAGISIN